MPRIDRFSSLAEYRAERDRAKAVLDEHEANLGAYVELIRDPSYRQALAFNAIGGAIRNWNPARAFGAVVHANDGFVENVLVAFLKSRAHTFKGRMLAWAVGLVVPYLVKTYATADNLHAVSNMVSGLFTRNSEEVEEDEEVNADL